MVEEDAGVDDVGCDAVSGVAVTVGRAEGQGMLVHSVEAPGGVALCTHDGGDPIGLDPCHSAVSQQAQTGGIGNGPGETVQGVAIDEVRPDPVLSCQRGRIRMLPNGHDKPPCDGRDAPLGFREDGLGSRHRIHTHRGATTCSKGQGEPGCD